MPPPTSTPSTTTLLTDSQELQSIRDGMFEIHKSRVNYGFEWRVNNLKLLKRMLVHHRSEWLQALKLDLHKQETESLGTELLYCENEIEYYIQNLKNWMQPTVTPTPMHSFVGTSRILHLPLLAPGVLIIGPSNYPIQLSLIPAAGALMGGNPVLLKPSELCVNTERLLKRLIYKYFGSSRGALQITCGGAQTTALLLQQHWGKVFFTGSERVGRIVANYCAATVPVSPVVLECGGKSAVVMDGETTTNRNHLRTISNRIVWGKTLNAGQTCVAPDYLVCQNIMVNDVCEELVKSVERQFTSTPEQNSELGRLVSVAHAERLVDMLLEVESNKETRLLCGGSKQCNPSQKYIAPTILIIPPSLYSCRLLQEEIFGPILPIVVTNSREESIQFVNSRPGTPLALYVFTTSEQVYQHYITSCRAASGMRNDVILHFGNTHLPIGGLGSSGCGGLYHGKETFRVFTHEYATVHRSVVQGDYGNLRFHPYEGWKGKVMVLMLKLPNVPVVGWSTRLVIVLLLVWWFVLPMTTSHTARQVVGEVLASALERAAVFIRESLVVEKE